MGEFQSWLVETKFPDQKQIEIEGARLAARATSSTETRFDGEQAREQLASQQRAEGEAPREARKPATTHPATL